MRSTFKPTDKQQLYIRYPMGIYYGRLYVGGKTKWVSLGTKVKPIAKIELAKLLQTHYSIKDSEALARSGKATFGQH
jgi:hypothetical protein